MRALPICFLALMLSGCSMLSRSPVEPVQSTATPPKAEPPKPASWSVSHSVNWAK